jgi:hypothetical protein
MARSLRFSGGSRGAEKHIHSNISKNVHIFPAASARMLVAFDREPFLLLVLRSSRLAVNDYGQLWLLAHSMTRTHGVPYFSHDRFRRGLKRRTATQIWVT